MTPLLILRPEPGAAATAARAIAAGWHVIAAPPFTIAAEPWDAPDPAAHDALMLTSAQAVRHAGGALDRYRALPVYAVGEATGVAAMEAGFADVRMGSADSALLVTMMVRDGIRQPLHLAGREHRMFDAAPIPIARRIVYAADPVAELPAAALAAVAQKAVALIHSQRAGAVFADLLAKSGIDPAGVSVAALSGAAGAGPWIRAKIAEAPNDVALLAAAARLCEKG
jgi:uroporphyrinogen-III synthase